MAVVFLRTMYPYPVADGGPRGSGPRLRTETSALWQPFEQLLRDCLADLGHTVVEQTAHPNVPDDGVEADLRIVAHRTRRDGPGDLFYKQMHLPTIFTIDRWGWGADHSGSQDAPDLDAIDQAEADDLVAGLYRRYVEPGRSKLAQPARRAGRGEGDEPPPGYVFLPAQMPSDYVQLHHSPVPVAEFVLRVARWAAARRQHLVIKLHPGLHDGAFPEVADAVRLVAGESGYVTCSDANVHDLLAGAIGVFTLNSGVGFEALLHRKPVVTFGNCDYRWVTFPGRLDDLDDLDDARSFLLGYSDDQARRAARFLFFYCRGHGLSTEPEDLPDSRRRLREYLDRTMAGC